jgi:integrase
MPIRIAKPAGVRNARGEPTGDAMLDQVDAWVAYCQTVDGQCRAHADTAGRWVRRWLEFVGDDALTPDACVRWLSEMCGGVRLSPQTVRNRMSSCRRFCGWLVVQGLAPANPWASVPAPRGRARQGADAFTDADVEALVAHARKLSTDHASPFVRRCALNRARLYRFLQMTGLRRSEARGQLWGDVDLERASMVVTVDKSKRQDAIPLSAPAVELLREIRGETAATRAAAKGKLFQTIVTDKALEADCKACGIEGRGKWHRFRVGFVSESFERGVPAELIQRLVRHRSVDQTHRYLRHREDRLRTAIETRGEKTSKKVVLHSRTLGSAADTVGRDSPMTYGAPQFTSSATSRINAAPMVESFDASPVSARSSDSSSTRKTETARASREPSRSRGDRICTRDPSRLASLLIQTAQALMETAQALIQQERDDATQGNAD